MGLLATLYAVFHRPEPTKDKRKARAALAYDLPVLDASTAEALIRACEAAWTYMPMPDGYAASEAAKHMAAIVRAADTLNVSLNSPAREWLDARDWLIRNGYKGNAVCAMGHGPDFLDIRLRHNDQLVVFTRKKATK